MFWNKPKAVQRTQRPLGLYVTKYWIPEIPRIQVVFYEMCCRHGMNMQVKDMRRLMNMYYEDRRKVFLQDIRQQPGTRRDQRRIQLLALRAFRNHYRAQWAEFDKNNPDFKSRY